MGDFIRALRLAILAPALLLAQALLLSGAVAQAQSVPTTVFGTKMAVELKLAGINAGTPRLTSVRSRKTHGFAGSFDLILGSTVSSPTTEPRSGGVGHNHLLVFVFDKAVGSGDATVTAGAASVGAPTFNGNEMSVPLSGVANAQYVTVAVSNVGAVGDPNGNGVGSVRVGFLLGDVNGSRNVSLSDMLLVDAQLSQPVTSANFLCDLNTSGTVSISDEMVIDANLSQALPSPDVTPPTVSITSPNSNTTYTSAQTVTITATASDNIGVTRVEFYDGATLKNTVTSPPYQHTWPIGSNDNGTHTWTATAYDANTSTSSTPVSLIVNIPVQIQDTTPPSIAITAPTTGATWSTTSPSVTLSGTASDNIGVTAVTWLNSANGGSGSAGGTTSWSGTISLVSGSNTITMSARDAANNVGTATLTVTYTPVSPPSPGAVTASPQSGNFVSASFNLSTGFTSSNAAVTGCEYTTNGSTWSPATVSGSIPTFTCTKTGVSGTNGQVLTLAMRATNSAGVGTATAITRTVDATAPTTSSNVSGNWVAVDQTVTLAASDIGGAGVAYTQFCTDLSNTCVPNFSGASLVVTCTAGSVCQVYVRFQSTDSVGNVEPVKSALVKLDKALPADGTLTATPGNAQVTLGWSGFSDAGSGLSVSAPYKLVFAAGSSPASCSAGTALYTGTGTSYTHTGLVNGTTYYYRLCAADAAGNISVGATANARTQGTNQPPVANAGPDQYAQTLTAISFNGGASSDPDGTITSYAWTFGDGASASGVGVAHYYSTPGIYTVTLTVTDNLGATASATAKANISNRPPVANAGPDQGGTVGVAVTLSGAASSDPDGSIVSYAWTFGDGLGINSGNVPSVTHTYSTAGVYNATLTVTDNSGATASDVAVITISPASTGGPFRWSKRFGGTGGSSAASYSSAVDAAGNVIVAGAFWGSVDFGGGPLTSAGSSDIFVAKYSPTGAHIWSKRFGSTLDDVANGVAVDASGNVILVGAFRDTINFGGATLTAVWGGAGPKGSDIFIAKFSPTGAHLWSQRFGSAVDDSANGVAVDGSGNIVVVGSFRGIVSFGGASFTSNRDTWDLFLAKYSPDGQHVWSETFGGTGTDNGNGIAIDGDGNISITGSFDGSSADFGGGALSSGGGSITPFFAKYSSAGTHIWSKAAGIGIGYAVAADSGGNTVATGYVMGAVDFGGGPLTDMGSLDAFVVKYSPTGAHLWSKRVGGASSDEGFGIATDSGGNVLLAGTFQGTADFGNGALTSAGSWDAVVVKYSAAGSPLWSKRYGSTGDDVAHSAAFDSSGNAIITGTFQGTVNFGGGTMTSTGWNDLFILSLGP